MASRGRSSHSGAQNNSSNLKESIQPLPQEASARGNPASAPNCHLEVAHITSVDSSLDQASHLGKPCFKDVGSPQPWRRGSARTD